MRIAVAGAHNTGKSTLVGELVASLPSHEAVDEPYYLLEAEGVACAEPPTLDDFEVQLERSIQALLELEGDCVFDRCPLDLLAYLLVHEDSDRFEVERWLPRVREAMRTLDRVVFVPIEHPERIDSADLESPDLRRRVDDALQGIVLDDPWSFGVPPIEVSGTLEERTRQVLARPG